MTTPRFSRRGVGCSTNGDPREAVELVHAVLDEYDLAASGVASVATLDRRINLHAGLIA